MTSSRKHLLLTSAAAIAMATVLAAHADLAPWMQTAISGSAIEAALYRAMDLPGIKTLYPRPASEARAELSSLITVKPGTELYALRAHADEQALDFTAAEADWKAFVAHSDAATKVAAELQLADFYHRRNKGSDEIAALEAAAALPSPATEKFLAADRQQAWQTFPRALNLVKTQALGDDATLDLEKQWIARYPAEPAPRVTHLTTLLDLHRFPDAQRAIDDYKTAFPQDALFPIQAAALLAFDQGDTAATNAALAQFDKAYQPLWDPAIVAAYFQLLAATHTGHAFLASNRAELAAHPDDLLAATKIFNYYQQGGHLDAAIDTLAQYGASKDARHAPWSPDEFYTLAKLLDQNGQYPQAARFYYALASTTGKLSATPESAEEAGLTGLIDVLLSAPDQPIALGAGNLSIFSDIATVDQGPGYLNGILSLWLNSADPASELHNEEAKATPYFHRAKAAELLAILDQRFPATTARPTLHAKLIQAFIDYGQDDAIKQAGSQFLTDFPHAPERQQVALSLADAYARAGDTKSEFALYDNLLTELAAGLQGMPLSANIAAAPSTTPTPTPTDDYTPTPSTPTPTAAQLLQQSLSVDVNPPATATAAQQYGQILERYLGRLTATNQLPAALTVLRHELDRSPNDPLLYQRLADFLDQQNLDAQEEQVYQTALARFSGSNFYDKLARFYIRRKRNADFDTLTHKVVDIFAGTDLESYFANVNRNWGQEYLQLNLYAAKRFPHDLVFTRNLLNAYRARPTANSVAWEQLIRQHWQDSPELQAQFFDYLSRHHKLAAELAALNALAPSAAEQQQNPAATHELAEIDLWQSHFEQSAPLFAQLTTQYPADTALGDQAVSLFRSLAYFDPTQIATAVAIEQHLSAADPTNLDRLATIGDIYANSTAASLNLDPAQQLAQAQPFWQQMTAVHPGQSDGYLASATVLWDYFQFDAALAQLTAARTHFHNPTLFGYEAGAIYENKHDYPHAIAEYTLAAIANPDPTTNGDNSAPTDSTTASTSIDPNHPSLYTDATDTPTTRLNTLAALPKYAALVDQTTAKAVADNPTLNALQLRISILKTLHRQAAIAPAVDAAITRATTLDALSGLASFSQQQDLTHQYQTSLIREATLTTDPVQHIQIEYQLAQSYQDAKDIPAAQRIIEAVYAANPRLIGVVRTTTGFYWTTKQPRPAIATLIAASQAANPSLAHDFTLEAIAKSNQSADYAGARALLKPLLTADPFNAQYLSLQADSFALAHDDASVRDLYTATLAAIKASALNSADKRSKTALAREGLIPALTALQDYAGAEDQHIALISAFPEDDGTLQNAIAYARLHGREPQLVAFLSKAVDDSPRDSRFAIDLARVDVQFEDYPGALNAYSKAIAIRADRPDLFIARADLEEHTQSFDDACADYDRMYQLTYKDPQWMRKSALARARQGKPDLAVKALQAAYIDGSPGTPDIYFEVAEQLAAWNLLPQADNFAQQAVKLAGDDLMTDIKNKDGAIFYATLLTRERKAAQAFALLTQLRDAANVSPSSPAIVVQQVEKQGIAAVTDSDWRAALVKARQQQAQSTFSAAVQQMATTAGELYTPEEKSSFATLLDAQRANRPADEAVALWIPAAAKANLKDREAQWRSDILLKGGKDLAPAQLQPFATLEDSRMDFTFEATTLDAYAAQLKPTQQANVLGMAATAWRNAGNTIHETADLRKLVLNQDQQQFQQRLFDLYLKSNTDALLLLTVSKSAPIADAATNYIFASGNRDLFTKALANRATTRPAVWNSSTTALIGLYLGDTSPSTDAAFTTALADGSIGERLAAKPDETKQLTGNPWFYYANRYGLALALQPRPAHDPEDYLAAQLELSSNDATRYTALAQTYLDAHNPTAAILEYRHAIEADATDPAPDVAIAEAFWSEGKHDEAVASWNTALTKLHTMVDDHSVPEIFWTTFAAIAADARANQLGPQLKPAMNSVLEYYIRKNDNYRTPELLQSAYFALGKQNAGEATAWVLALIGDANSNTQRSMLAELPGTNWFPATQLDAVYQRWIALRRTELPAAGAGDESYELTNLYDLEALYIQWLLGQHRDADAQRIFDAIPASQRNTAALVTIAIRLAAKQSQLAALLASYTTDGTPSFDVLTAAANTLRLAGDDSDSRLVLEFLFNKKLQQQTLAATDYLALAEARINTNDLKGALDLLNRLTEQGDLYENLDAATSLLVHTGHYAEALPMLERLANGTPWSDAYRLRLGEAQLALKQSTDAATTLTAVAASDQAAYTNRAKAARALAANPTTQRFGSGELNLLPAGSITPQQADEPYFVYARIDAAAAAALPQRASILRAALAAAPAATLNKVHLALFETGFTQKDYAAASIAIAPILAGDRSLLATSTQRNDDADVDSSSPIAGVDDLPTLFPTKSARLTFILDLATMDEHLANSSQAIVDLKAAVRLSDDEEQKNQLHSRIKTLQAALDLAQQNAARAPVIQDSVEQTVIVRPRLNSPLPNTRMEDEVQP